MKKKIVTLLLVAAMTGTMVVGCGSKADDKTSDTKTEQTDDKKDTEEKKELADDEYQYVSAADTEIFLILIQYKLMHLHSEPDKIK